MYDGTLKNKNSGETSTGPDDGDPFDATYPRWELTARKFGEVYVVTTTTDEDTALRRYRTHVKIGTEPALRRKNTVADDWEHILGDDADAGDEASVGSAPQTGSTDTPNHPAASEILARAGNLMGWPLPSTIRPEYIVPADPMDDLQCDSCQ